MKLHQLPTIIILPCSIARTVTGRSRVPEADCAMRCQVVCIDGSCDAIAAPATARTVHQSPADGGGQRSDLPPDCARFSGHQPDHQGADR